MLLLVSRADCSSMEGHTSLSTALVKFEMKLGNSIMRYPNLQVPQMKLLPPDSGRSRFKLIPNVLDQRVRCYTSPGKSRVSLLPDRSCSQEKLCLFDIKRKGVISGSCDMCLLVIVQKLLTHVMI